MAYLLWAIVNAAVFILFVRICFKATTLIKEKIGVLSSLIFIFGLLFLGCSRTQTSNQNKSWTFNSNDSLDQTSSDIEILMENDFVTKYYLGIYYKKDKQENNFATAAETRTLGLMCGTNWKPLHVIVEKANNSKFKYSVTGLVEWSLLGAKLYTQVKSYDGFAYTNAYQERFN